MLIETILLNDFGVIITQIVNSGPDMLLETIPKDQE